MIIPETWPQSLIGGALIGLAAALFLLLDGRIAGVSGIISGSLRGFDAHWRRNLSFLIGLILGPVLYRIVFDHWPLVRIEGSLAILAVGGLLVGFGTRLGGGCTSGHGVCGLARFSPRSLIAVITFLAAGILTVAAMNALGVS
jgi:uncharacterized membrane protein YedE/YeeE